MHGRFGLLQHPTSKPVSLHLEVHGYSSLQLVSLMACAEALSASDKPIYDLRPDPVLRKLLQCTIVSKVELWLPDYLHFVVNVTISLQSSALRLPLASFDPATWYYIL